MGYWCVVRSEPSREGVARASASIGAIMGIDLQRHAARWTCGVAGLIMSGDGPARVSDAVIDAIRARERGGYVILDRPKPFLCAVTVFALSRAR
jgi:hypothetical protein